MFVFIVLDLCEGLLLIDYYRGKVISEAGAGEEIVYADIEADVLSETRTGIPVSKQRRFDVYKDVSK